MSVEIEELLAWVDGELDAGRADEVAMLVERDPELQKLASSFRASQLPYREAFDQMSDPQMPASLRQTLDDLDPAPEKQRAGRTYLPVAIAVSGILTASVASYLFGERNAAMSHSPVVTLEDAGFARAIAGYQAFYVRETVEGVQDNNVSAVAARLVESSDFEFEVPDLEQHGFQFMRVQQLAFGDAPLVQLIYLPSEGMPLALCFMIDEGPDTDLVSGQHYGMQTAEWRLDNKRFVIVANEDRAFINNLYDSVVDQWPG